MSSECISAGGACSSTWCVLVTEQTGKQNSCKVATLQLFCLPTNKKCYRFVSVELGLLDLNNCGIHGVSCVYNDNHRHSLQGLLFLRFLTVGVQLKSGGLSEICQPTKFHARHLLVCSTPTCTGSTFLSECSTNSELGVTMHRCLQHKAPRYLVDCCTSVRRSSRSSTSTFRQPSAVTLTALPSECALPSGFFCRWPEGLECTSRHSPGLYAQQWQFPLDTQDIRIRWTLTACSALEADAAMRYRNLRLTLTLTLTLDVLFFTCQHLESTTLQPSKVDGLVDAVCCLTCRIFGVQ